MYPNTTKASFGSATASGSAYMTPPVTAGLAPLEELSKQLEGATSRVYETANRVRGMADNLFGAIPESAETTANKIAGRDGKVGSLNDQADVLHAALSLLDNQLARLEPLAPSGK